MTDLDEKKIAGLDTGTLLDLQRKLEAEIAVHRRGNLHGTRIGAHKKVDASFNSIGAEIRKLESEIRHRLGKGMELPAEMLTKLATLRAVQQAEDLRAYLHELVEAKTPHGQHDYYGGHHDPWPVRDLADIQRELAPIQAEINRRLDIQNAQAELEALETKKKDLRARIGAGR